MSARYLSQALLGTVEQAGLNASATRDQFWLDGWLVRLAPGKAKRARCVNPLAPGALALDDKLARLGTHFGRAGLPPIVRITPFAQPGDLDGALEQRGWARFDDTRVMVLQRLAGIPMPPAPAGISSGRVTPEDYAALVGGWRGSTAAQIAAHVERLRQSPVPYQGWVWSRDGRPVACGQWAREGACVGLYDVFVPPAERGGGLARGLCSELLRRAAEEGARLGYLQVEADNGPARTVYRRLGFVDGYAYHYRSPVAGG